MDEDELPLAAMQLAENLILFRARRGLKQGQLANIAELPRSTIAHLETGAGNPSLSHLLKLSGALGITVEELIAKPHSEMQLLRASEVPFVTRARGEAKLLKLLPDPVGGMEMDRLELQPRARMGGSLHNAGTREYFTVVKGTIEVSSLGETHRLGEGDVLAFPGEFTHSYRNLEDRVSVGISVVVFAKR